jgi:hypothetical protein
MCQCHAVPLKQVANVSVPCCSSDTGGQRVNAMLLLWYRWPMCQCHVAPLIQVPKVSMPCCSSETGGQCVSAILFLWYRWPTCRCHVAPLIQVANVSVPYCSSDTGDQRVGAMLFLLQVFISNQRSHTEHSCHTNLMTYTKKKTCKYLGYVNKTSTSVSITPSKCLFLF